MSGISESLVQKLLYLCVQVHAQSVCVYAFKKHIDRMPTYISEHV